MFSHSLLVTLQLLFSSTHYAGVPIYFWSQSSSFYSQVAAALQLNFNLSVLVSSYLENSCSYSWQANTLLFSLQSQWDRRMFSGWGVDEGTLLISHIIPPALLGYSELKLWPLIKFSWIFYLLDSDPFGI